MPVLTDFQQLVSVGKNRTVELSPGSLAVLFSALDLIGQLHQWRGESSKLSTAEMDAIDSYVSTAAHELMVEIEVRTHEIGEPFALFVNAPPVGAIPMDGEARLQADYPALMDKIPDFWKSGVNFILPDMKGRSVVGQGFTYKTFSGTPYTVTAGGFGGKLEHTLSIDELPPHTHSVPRSTGTTSGSGGFSAQSYNPVASAITSASTGGGAAHDNMSPFLAGFWFIQAE